MSMQGVGGAGLPPWLRGPAETTRQPESAPARSNGAEAGRAAPPQAQRSAPAPAPLQAPAAAPDAAPEGVDAELWSLLTTEERAHFAHFQAMGGVTYGPGAARPTRPSVQGHRLDLRI